MSLSKEYPSDLMLKVMLKLAHWTDKSGRVMDPDKEKAKRRLFFSVFMVIALLWKAEVLGCHLWALE